MRDFVEWLGKNTKWIVSGVAALILMIKRDAATILCLIGAITNAIFGKILKRIINEARPRGARLVDPGMPSSHAQSLFYFATYLSLIIIQGKLSNFVGKSVASQILTCVLIMGLACTGAIYRVRKGLHTFPQISVGGIVGMLFAIFWQTFVQPLFVHIFIGLEWLVAPVLIIGAFTVGSVERKIREFCHRHDSIK